MFLHTFGDFLCCFGQLWAVCFSENRLKNEIWGMEDKKMYRARISSLSGKITVLVVICCCALPAQGKLKVVNMKFSSLLLARWAEGTV
jgi:hypothetical protein